MFLYKYYQYYVYNFIHETFIYSTTKCLYIAYMSTIGKNLQKRAKELGLTDAEVARRIGISPQRYNNYAKDIRQPDFETLEKICKVLRLSYNQLFEK